MRSAFMLFMTVVLCIAAPAAAQDWNIQVVDDAGNTGYSSRVIATSDGIPYILYQANNGVITLAWFVTGGGPGGWDRLTWGEADGYHLTMGMEIDDNDDIHIAYSKMTSPYRIRYGVFDHATKTWDLALEDASSSYGDLSLALWDSSGTMIPFIAVSQRASPYDIWVAKRDPGSGNWIEELVYDDYQTDRPSVAVDTTGSVHVSFYETSGGNLMYATNGTGVWTVEYVDIAGVVGLYNAIVIDAGNTPYIVYYDATNDDLKYAKLLN